MSKAALNALTVKLALELREDGILVNAVCPDLTATTPELEEMGARPVEEGAASVVWAATLPDERADGRVLPGRAAARVVSAPGVAVRTSADSVIPASDPR